jgi:hypothetical protein
MRNLWFTSQNGQHQVSNQTAERNIWNPLPDRFQNLPICYFTKSSSFVERILARKRPAVSRGTLSGLSCSRDLDPPPVVFPVDDAGLRPPSIVHDLEVLEPENAHLGCDRALHTVPVRREVLEDLQRRRSACYILCWAAGRGRRNLWICSNHGGVLGGGAGPSKSMMEVMVI